MQLQRFAILCAFLAPSLIAQNGSSLLVDVDWLAAHLKDPDLVLLHVGDRKQYDVRHIPGARSIAMMDLSVPMHHENPKEMMLELPPVSELRAKLESFGISDNSRIVIYVGDESNLQSATRIIFTLDYLGLSDRTSLLNGGLTTWTGAGQKVTAETSPVRPGKLTAHTTKHVVADAELVKSIRQGDRYKLVDARAESFYDGTQATYGKNGHIPGAISIPFTRMSDEAQTLDRQHIADVFRDAGIKPGDTVVAYCHVGQQATLVIFGARLLGYPTMLYDGAFEDWAVNERGPVEK